MSNLRFDWTYNELADLFRLPLGELTALAESVHRKEAAPDIQKCVLLSIKTGGCAENCGYCSQSAHHKADLTREPLLDVGRVLEKARQAKADGASRFCMGAAWRDLPQDDRFERIVEMVEGVSELGLEACVTLGMANQGQLERLKAAGLTAYNHNLDTGKSFYDQVVTTRTYEERLQTLEAARQAGVNVCCGGILGLGENISHRIEMLLELCRMQPHPESVPINLLVPVKGTPMENNPPVPFEEFLRMIAVARITMPKARIRLSAGRHSLSEAEQKECFRAGANSVFWGEKLLTTPNVPLEQDKLALGF